MKKDQGGMLAGAAPEICLERPAAAPDPCRPRGGVGGARAGGRARGVEAADADPGHAMPRTAPHTAAFLPGGRRAG